MKHTVLRANLFIFFLLYSLISRAQDAGIRFESGLSWTEIQAKAKAENKMIFMDCYATWCGPCKFMDKEIYPGKNVGDFFNAHFINVKVQMDRTPKDAQNIQDWYADADSISNKYQVSAFPAYLFFSSDGRALHKIVGASDSDSAFIAKATASLDSIKQFFTLRAKWENNKNDSVYLLNAILAAKEAGDDNYARKVANQYIEIIKDSLNKYNVELVSSLISSESDQIFKLFLNNAASIDKIEDNKDFVEGILSNVIFMEEISPLVSNDKLPIDWKRITENMQAKYPTLDRILFADNLHRLMEPAIDKKIGASIKGKQLTSKDWTGITRIINKRYKGFDCGEILLYREINYFYDLKSWTECAGYVMKLLDQYSEQLDGRNINNVIWYCIFFHITDKTILDRAIVYMEKLVKIEPKNSGYLDTYANLLYKTGDIQKAIEVENLAITFSNKSEERVFRDTLKKMQAGEITWLSSQAGS